MEKLLLVLPLSSGFHNHVQVTVRSHLECFRVYAGIRKADNSDRLFEVLEVISIL